MSRYIDADRLKEECYKFANDVSRSAMAFAQGQINAAPTADVVEVRHGEWIEKPNPWGQDGSHTYVCSVCNEQISILGNALPYCSFCGAKMDGERRANDGT